MSGHISHKHVYIIIYMNTNILFITLVNGSNLMETVWILPIDTTWFQIFRLVDRKHEIVGCVCYEQFSIIDKIPVIIVQYL